MTKNIKIGNKLIGVGQPVFIIAEAGVNHNGRLDLALKLVDAAARAGADAVKFQTFRAEQVVTGSGKMSKYQKRNIGKTESQLAMLKKLELNEQYYPVLIKRARARKIIFLSTPHGGFASVDFLQKLKIPAFKFGSGDLTNLPLLEYAAKFNKPMILGTGMATMSETKQAIKTIKRAGNNKIIALHCTSDYPCRPAGVNLKALVAMRDKLGVLVGYSDHTLGSQTAVMAATLGACLIEKHFTLDKNMPGPDHKASVEPDELKKVVKAIGETEKIMGSCEKRPIADELKAREIGRKSVVSLCDIKKGERFTKRNIGIKRPGTGLEPKYYYAIIGRTAGRNIKVDSLIKLNDLK